MNKHSHNLLVTVHAFVCKFQEDSDLLLTLYDGDEMKAITENYVVKWGRQGLARDLDQFDNHRVLFTVRPIAIVDSVSMLLILKFKIFFLLHQLGPKQPRLKSKQSLFDLLCYSFGIDGIQRNRFQAWQCIECRITSE